MTCRWHVRPEQVSTRTGILLIQCVAIRDLRDPQLSFDSCMQSATDVRLRDPQLSYDSCLPIRNRCASEWVMKLNEASLLDAAFEALKAGASGRKTVTDVQIVREHGCYLSLKCSKVVTFSAAHDWGEAACPLGRSGRGLSKRRRL